MIRDTFRGENGTYQRMFFKAQRPGELQELHGIFPPDKVFPYYRWEDELTVNVYSPIVPPPPAAAVVGSTEQKAASPPPESAPVERTPSATAPPLYTKVELDQMSREQLMTLAIENNVQVTEKTPKPTIAKMLQLSLGVS